MIALDRYPREITLRNGVTLVFRPMVRDDVDRLWVFFQRIPPADKVFFRQDVNRREVVQHWADTLDSWLVEEDPARYLAAAQAQPQKRGEYRPSPPNGAFKDDFSGLERLGIKP